MTASTTRAQLPALLGRVARVCKERVAVYIEAARPDLRFQSQLLLSLATLESSASRVELEDVDVRLLRSAASDAAAVCRTRQPDDAMHALAACLEEVVVACDAVLADTTRAGTRFLFADADVSVSRDGRRWRVRGTAGGAVNTFLDVALGEMLPLASHRIGELTVQILAWFAYENSLDGS